MSTVPFSQLTQEQRTRAAYLFADEIFGTDATAFEYVIERGMITRRVSTGAREAMSARATRNQSARVVMNQEVYITDELKRQVQYQMDALAVSVAKRLSNIQIEEALQ